MDRVRKLARRLIIKWKLSFWLAVTSLVGTASLMHPLYALFGVPLNLVLLIGIVKFAKLEGAANQAMQSIEDHEKIVNLAGVREHRDRAVKG
jgi:hypothetical protein